IYNGVMRFTNVRVPNENVLWEVGKGLKLGLITLNTGRLTLPISSVAAGKRCLEISRQWASERVQWGRAIGKHDAIAQKIGAMAANTFAMEAVAELCGAMADRGGYDIRLEAAIAKLYNSEGGWRIIDDTVQIRGGRAPGARGVPRDDALRAQARVPPGRAVPTGGRGRRAVRHGRDVRAGRVAPEERPRGRPARRGPRGLVLPPGTRARRREVSRALAQRRHADLSAGPRSAAERASVARARDGRAIGPPNLR